MRLWLAINARTRNVMGVAINQPPTNSSGKYLNI
jgi:hypothetical protein